MDLNDLSMEFFGARRSEETARTRTTTTVLARAVSDSEGGRVLLEVDGTTTTAEDAEGNQYGSTIVEVPTSPSVREGDVAIVTLSGGKEKSPVVTGVIGSGDRQQQQIDSAYTDDSTYYLLSSTVPATPTDDTWEAAGWSTSEPIIGQEETRTLYVSRRVELVDGTVTWSIPAKVVTSASLDVMRNAILSTVSETYTTKTEFAESSDTASGSGRTVETEDAAGLELIDLTVYGESVQDGTPSPDAPVEIRTVQGANLLPSAATERTASGLTFTVNADGSVTVKGTATASVVYDYLGMNAHNVTLTAGTYSLSGCPSGGSGSKWKLDINDTTDTYTTDYGSGTTFNVASTRTIRRCRIVVYSGQTVDFTFKPMLNAGSTATPYVPYGAIGVQAKSANLLAFTPGVETKSGITSTIAADGTWTLSGTATATINFYYTPITTIPVEIGDTFALSGMPTAGYGTSGWRVALSGSAYFGAPNGTVTSNSAGLRGMHVQVASGYTMPDGWSAKPIMVRGTTPAAAYEPYRESISYIPLQGNTLASLPDGTKDVLHVEQGRAWIEKNVGSVTKAISDMNDSADWPGWSNSGIRAIVGGGVNANFGSPHAMSNIKSGSGVFGANTLNSGSDGLFLTRHYHGKTAAEWKAQYPDLLVTIYAKRVETQTIDLGEVSLPTVQDGDTVRIIAEVTPEFDTSWWRNTAIVNGMEHAQSTADAASSGVTDLREYTDSRLEQTSRDITATFTKSIELVGETTSDITERVSTIENTVRINANGVTIAASDSPISANLNNAGLVFSADNEAVLTLNAQTSTAEAERVSIGNYQWREMGDNAIALVWIGE